MPMVGPYVLSGTPQVGGYARLYKAVHEKAIERVVAVKVFDPPVRVENRVLTAAWTNELETYQRLGESPNLARLLDWGRADDGAPYLVFEWLDGDLMDQVEKQPFEGWDDFWPVARDVLRGLELIHNAGFVHRDIKPENVLRGAEGLYKVADFGTTRLAEAMRAGVTMALVGTIPYAPPELGTPGPSPSYDLYSFAVMSIICLTGTPPAELNVPTQFEALDLPPDVQDVLRTCLAVSVDERPESAGILLAQLQSFQDARERRRTPSVDVHFAMHTSVVQQASKLLSMPTARLAEYLIEDLRAVAAFSIDGRGERPILQACGQTLIFRLEYDRAVPSMVRIQRIVKPSSHTLDIAHANWFRPNVRIRTTVPNDQGLAARALESLQQGLADHEAERSAVQAAADNARVFNHWRSALQAKFTVEDERAAPVHFDSWERDGARVRFSVKDLSAVTVGENRLVTRGRRRVLFGEVEQVDNGKLVLYVTKGDATQLPKTGTLAFDAEASKSKLRREQAALDRLSAGRAVRPPLRDLLLDPSVAASPSEVAVDSYFQSHLDEPKQKAVAAALGSSDFLLVQGPPGTGKTTFIAELVAQEISRNPEARILLTAQTHVAVDHALSGIAQLSPEASIVRLGRLDQLSEGVEKLGVAARLEETRSVIAEAGRAFLAELAVELGLDVQAASLEALATDLELRAERLSRLRSRLALNRDERRVLAERVSEHQASAAKVLDIAASLERTLAATTAANLVGAADRFLEVGIELAASLESGGRANDQLLAVERVIRDLNGQLETESAGEASAKAALAESLKVDTTTGAKELLARVQSHPAVVEDAQYNRLAELTAEWSERFGKGPEFNAVIIAGSSVVGATCVGLTGLRGADSVDFDLCIIDEASKATATETLVPLVQSRRWILVGDQKQLPPFVEAALFEREFLDRFDLTSQMVKQTLFSELLDGLPAASIVSLTHQHRMHPAIGDLISRCFYEGTLTSSPRGIGEGIGVAVGAPVVWLDTSHRLDRREVPSGKSYLNPTEARMIGRILDRLEYAAAKAGTRMKVAVLSGYDPQRQELLDLVHRHESELVNLDIHVANVDAYQGQEADVAIFSVTRSNEAGDLGFLRQEPRINVALSRGRDALVIVGDASFIRSSSSASNPLADVLRHIERTPTECKLVPDGAL